VTGYQFANLDLSLIVDDVNNSSVYLFVSSTIIVQREGVKKRLKYSIGLVLWGSDGTETDLNTIDTFMSEIDTFVSIHSKIYSWTIWDILRHNCHINTYQLH